MTLAEMNRFYLPRWLNIGLWIIAEATIICTDVGQVRRRSVLGIKLILLGHWDCYRDKSPKL
jgi:Mn2+/Fe2+ NRAMP family transporter